MTAHGFIIMLLQKSISCLLFTLATLCFVSTAFAAQPPLLILLGPPFAGKTEQAQLIENNYGIPVVSVEALLEENAQALAKLQHPGTPLSEMRYDPAMSRFLEAKLKTMNLSRGVVFDGYPVTNYQAEQLKNLLPSLGLLPLVLQLDVPDNVVQQRAVQAGQNAEQQKATEQRINDYHREFDGAAYYFPKAKIVKIDGTKPVSQVSAEIDAALTAAGITRARQ